MARDRDRVRRVRARMAETGEKYTTALRALESEEYRCGNPQCPQAGKCGGECARNFWNKP